MSTVNSLVHFGCKFVFTYHINKQLSNYNRSKEQSQNIMTEKKENKQSTVMKFIQDFFVFYDKNRHVLNTLFTDDSTFIILGNRMSGHAAIQQGVLTMATTTHKLKCIDILSLGIPMKANEAMYQVLCAGEVEFGGDNQKYGFTATFLVYFMKPNIFKVVTFNERLQWAKLS